MSEAEFTKIYDRVRSEFSDPIPPECNAFGKYMTAYKWAGAPAEFRRLSFAEFLTWFQKDEKSFWDAQKKLEIMAIARCEQVRNAMPHGAESVDRMANARV